MCSRRKLYRRRVKHDADGGTEALRWQVAPELGADSTRVAVRTGDLAPDDPDLGSPNCSLSAVDVSYTLTSVPLCRLGGVDAFELEERGSGVGVSLAALVGNVLSLHVKAVRLLRHGGRFLGSEMCVDGIPGPSVVAAG